MFKLTILALALTLALTLTSASIQADWLVYKKTHNKEYSGEEDIIRRYIWQSNLQKIQKHNELYAKGLISYYMGENQFTDMSDDEVSSTRKGLIINSQLNPGNFQTGLYKGVLPDSVDWRTKGYVTRVKNQFDCGSCWAFTATGSLEGQHFNSTGKLVSLSESNLVDCSQNFGNNGCHGGSIYGAFKYIIQNKGIDTETSYPYLPKERKCAFKKDDVGATEESYKEVESGSEDALQKAVAEIGPISVAIDSNHTSFTHYKGDVYDEPDCSSTKLSHGVLVVGYGTQSGKDYWLVKNSWGTTWGMKGYILMSRNKNNQCGIATHASYPIV